jgi:hypothetical protein
MPVSFFNKGFLVVWNSYRFFPLDIRESFPAMRVSVIE